MLTLNAYETLLLDYQPRPIRSRAAYETALRQVEQLMTSPKLGRAASEMIELLSLLIEQYEANVHPPQATTPASILDHLREVRGVTKAEIARATGIPRSTISNVLASRRSISKANAIKLSKYFGVSMHLFLDDH